jgi:hypothetical protein
MKLTTLPSGRETTTSKTSKATTSTTSKISLINARTPKRIASLLMLLNRQLPTAEPSPSEEAPSLRELVSTISTVRLSSKFKSMERVSTTVANVQLIWPATVSKWKKSLMESLLAEW